MVGISNTACKTEKSLPLQTASLLNQDEAHLSQDRNIYSANITFCWSEGAGDPACTMFHTPNLEGIPARLHATHPGNSLTWDNLP
jgi:hypothetical protein